MKLEAILSYVIPVLSIFLTYILGRVQSASSERHSVEKERYLKLYLPFISMIYKLQLYKTPVYWFECVGRSREFDRIYSLIINNLQYMDTNSVKLVYVFIEFVEKCGFARDLRDPDDDSDPEIENISKEEVLSFEQNFLDFVTSMLHEGSKLSQKLQMPDICAEVMALCNQENFVGEYNDRLTEDELPQV